MSPHQPDLPSSQRSTMAGLVVQSLRLPAPISEGRQRGGTPCISVTGRKNSISGSDDSSAPQPSTRRLSIEVFDAAQLSERRSTCQCTVYLYGASSRRWERGGISWATGLHRPAGTVFTPAGQMRRRMLTVRLRAHVCGTSRRVTESSFNSLSLSLYTTTYRHTGAGPCYFN